MLINASDPTPSPWSSSLVVEVHGLEAVESLHSAWLGRTPVVVRLHVDAATFREPESIPLAPWKVDPGIGLERDRLHFLLWANNYDARGGIDPVWWWARKAIRVGAFPVRASEPGDIDPAGFPEERPLAVWIDGGPRSPIDHLLPADHRTVHSESVDLGRVTLVPPDLRPEPSIELATDQFAAVDHRVGGARIIAPAGSGKTRVLTERLRHLLGDRKWERETVAAIAYNKRAQEELVARCSAFSPRVSTLNALGWELLGRPSMIDDREVRNVLGNLVPRQQRRANTDPLAPYLDALSAVRMGLRNPNDVEREGDDIPGFAVAFEGYRDHLKDRGVVDFDEQIYAAVERLLSNGSFRREQQQRFRHLLVDEFQDLTPAHVLLVRLLSAPGFDVFGVGDDDQVIYGHAGADPDFLLRFDSYFPGAGSHPLEVNYRSRAAIVEGARFLLGYNNRRVAKTISVGREEASAKVSRGAKRSAAIVVERHQSVKGASALVDTVQGWLNNGAVVTDIAVLTRVNSLLLAPQVALREAGIPTGSSVDARVLDRTGTRAALAYLRIAAGAAEGAKGFDRNDLLEVLRRPSRGLPIWIDKWFRQDSMRPSDLRAIATRMEDDKVGAKLDALASDLEGLVRNASKPDATVRTVLRYVKDTVGLGQAMSMLDASSSASHMDDLEALEMVADLHPSLDGFETWLRGALGGTRAGTNDGPGPVGAGVTLATVHKVKGLEWPFVAVFAVNDGVLPHRLSEDVEEERRVLHVAITRAQEQVVVLTDAAKYSPFLAELDGSAEKNVVVNRPASGSGTADSSPTAHKSGGKLSAAGESRPFDEAVFEALRVWRRERSKKDGVAPYVVFSDETLREIARAKPKSLTALSRVKGIGPAKLDRYGDEVMYLTG